MDKLTIPGKDNRGEPRQAWADKLASLDDGALVKEVRQMIWLSGYTNNNPHSDYHWQADACYDEAERRGKPELYKGAYDYVLQSVS